MTLALLVLGCTEDPAPHPASVDPSPSIPLVPTGLVEARDSVVSITATGGAARMWGIFADRAPLSFHHPTDTVGSCQILSYTPSTCDTCNTDEICVDGTCELFPQREDAGTLTWAFPGGSVDVDPDVTNYYYNDASGVAEGAHSVSGAGFSATIEPVDWLIPTESWDDLLANRQTGETVTLRWSNPDPQSFVKMRLTDCTGSHGGLAPYELSCEAADTGELVLDGHLLDIFASGDWNRGECGSHALKRFRRVALGDDAVLESTIDANFFWYPSTP